MLKDRKIELILLAVGTIIAIIALIPAFGDWLSPRNPPQQNQVPTPPPPTETATSEPSATPPPTLTRDTSPTTPLPTDTVRPTDTRASEPSVTTLPTSGPPAAPTPSFSDSFDSEQIDREKWVVTSEGLFVQEGRLCGDYENDGVIWSFQGLRANLAERFSFVEFQAVILDGTPQGHLGFNSTCNAGEEIKLHFELRSDQTIEGHYGDTYLGWDHSLELRQPITVRLIQDEDIVRVYVNDQELSEPYPCSAMGMLLEVYAGASPGHRVHGCFDYIQAWQSPPPTVIATPEERTMITADWNLFDDFDAGALDEEKWTIARRESSFTDTVSSGYFHFDGSRPGVEFPMSMEVKPTHLEQIRCTFPQGIAVRASLGEGTSIESYLSIHSGWDDLDIGESEYALGLVSGPGKDETQARVRYINPVFDKPVGATTGLRVDNEYEIAAIWDGFEVRFYLDGTEIPLLAAVTATEFLGNYLRIDFAPIQDGRLNAFVQEVWVKCR